MRSSRAWIVLLTSIAASAAAASKPPASVTLPLADYLKLDAQARQVERARSEARETAEPPVHEVVSQRTLVRLDGELAEVTASFEVEIRGTPLVAVSLPTTGVPWRAAVEPTEGAALADSSAGLELAPSHDGRYTVTVDAVAAVEEIGGVRRIELAPVVAPVTLTELDLPADLDWSCRGAVVAGDRVNGVRRRLTLALERSAGHVVEVRRDVEGDEEEILARSSVVTLLALGGDDVRRHDVVLYEVSRGSLASLELELPPALDVDRVATDEGEAPPFVEQSKLRVMRSERLATTGFLVVSSRLETDGTLPLHAVEPSVPVRARYLAVSAATATSADPQPASSWSRIDLGDLPRGVREIAEALDLVAAWRAVEDVDSSTVALSSLPAVEPLQTVVSHRATTTLLTDEGMLLHRDVLAVARGGAGLELVLPPDSTLWSCEVDGVAVRPVVRGSSTIVPLALKRRDTTVEVVVVERRDLPLGRSSLDIAVPEVRAPVLTHSWRLLLPESHRYRFRDGDLRPAAHGQTMRRHAAPQIVTAAATGSGSGEATGRRIVDPSGRGALRGTVVDNDGHPLPGVTVTLTAFDLSATTIAGVVGEYEFVGLPPRVFEIEFTLPGFRTVARGGVRVRGDRSIRFDVEMRPESFGGEIVVTAEAPLVDTTSTVSGLTVNTDSLPSRGRRGGRSISSKAPKTQPPSDTDRSVAEARSALSFLNQGLVGGVRPVPVTIPESGKSLLLEGALPPSRVAVVLDVKAAKRR